jgi:hypothetical protein
MRVRMIKKLISFFLCFVFCVNLIQVIGEAPGGGPFTITVSVEGNGHFMYGELSENNRVIEVPAGSNHIFYIEAEEGYEIEEVFVDGASVGIITEHKFNDISDNHTLHAKFVPSQYKIHVTSGENGQIKYNGQPENGTDVFVNKNEDATFEIEADQGYDIDDVLVNGDSVGAIPSYTFMNVTTDQSIHATFTPQTFDITIIVKDNEGNEGGGEVSCIDPLTGIPYDATRTFSITPGDGYRLKEIIDNGENRGADNSYQLDNIRENHTIEVIFEPIGDGTMHTITVQQPVNGSVATADGPVEGQVTVEDGYDITLIVTPADGYRISEVNVTQDGYSEDWSWNLTYIGNGEFEFPLFEVRGNMTIEFVFEEADLESLLENNFVVLEEETTEPGYSDLKESLKEQFAGYGYVISEENILITSIDINNINNVNIQYGDLTFEVIPEGGGQPVAGTGYIVKSPADIIFKLDDGNEPVIKVVRPSEDPEIDELEIPAWDTGTMEIFGYGNLAAVPLADLDSDENGKIQLPFYCAQFHIFNFMPPGDGNVNLYGFYVIQDDALCVRVSAKSGESEQKTIQWDLNRYTNLTEGNDTSYVFFGNDEFILSLPPNGIGGAESLEIEEEDFGGYYIEENEDGTYSVNFRSDFYDDITVDLKINGSEERQIRIRRVGVNIADYMWDGIGPKNATVSHGTQNGTLIDYNDGKYYRIYATYYIPDRDVTAPYGLYVIYTYANGTKESRIITNPCDEPSPNRNAENYVDGVFIYGQNPENPDTACCDYLLYSAVNDTNAPVKINVTVLKGDPAASGSFSGVFFGSGAGVEWVKEEDE